VKRKRGRGKEEEEDECEEKAVFIDEDEEEQITVPQQMSLIRMKSTGGSDGKQLSQENQLYGSSF
jgi:hypothetical protein